MGSPEDGAQNAQQGAGTPSSAAPGSCAGHAALCLPRTEGSVHVGAQNRFILVPMSPTHTSAQTARCAHSTHATSSPSRILGQARPVLTAFKKSLSRGPAGENSLQEPFEGKCDND